MKNQPLPILKPSKVQKNNMSQFIESLLSILQNERDSHIISWSKDGLSFSIIDSRLFAEKILPSFFNHQNIFSFIRQLNMYNFAKYKHEDGYISYKHPFFVRNNPEMIKNILRKKPVKKAKNRDSCNFLADKNYHDMALQENIELQLENRKTDAKIVEATHKLNAMEELNSQLKQKIIQGWDEQEYYMHILKSNEYLAERDNDYCISNPYKHQQMNNIVSYTDQYSQSWNYSNNNNNMI